MSIGNSSTRSKVTCAFMVFMLIMTQSLLAAGSGTIKGKILDKITGDPLIGANVVVMNTSLGGAANIDGIVTIYGVPTGERTLKISYVGYLPITEQVIVPEGGVVEKEFQLAPQAIEGQEVVVTAQARGQNEAINQQLAAKSMVNVVSSEKMKELPDANIAESIGRLPGVSLKRDAGEANAVVVRGLSPKYNNVTIEGVPLNSTNYQDRGVDLSLISDDMVRGVEVSKTLRPDMDADALGGTVNLTLKTAQEGLHYDVRGNGGYTKLDNSYSNYKFAGTVSDRFLNDKIGLQVQGNIEEKQLPSDNFNAGYNQPVGVTKPFVGFDLPTASATVTQTQLHRNRYGASAILDYSSDFVDIKFFNVYDQKKDSNLTRSNKDDFSSNGFTSQIFETVTKTEQRTHSIQALFKFAGTELPISLSYTKGDVSAPGQEFDIAGGENVGYAPLNVAQTYFTQPSQLMNHMGTQQDSLNSASHLSLSSLSQLYVSQTTLSDHDYDAKADWKVPFKLSDNISGILSAGGKYHSVDRTSIYAQRYLMIQFGQGQGARITLSNFCATMIPNYSNDLTNKAGLDARNFADPNYTSGQVLGYAIGPQYNIYELLKIQNAFYPQHTSLYYLNGSNSYAQDYTDKENSAAGYIMGEFNIGSKLTVVPGVRFQEEKTDIQSYHLITSSTAATGLGAPPDTVEYKRDNPNWYPSINIKYKATDNIQIMGAAYRSVSLPSFTDISPMVIFNPGANPQITSGNPFLKPSTATNLDLGVSFSNNNIGLFTVNVFYKEISNLIYQLNNYQPFNKNILPGYPADLFNRLPATSSNYFDTAFAKQLTGTISTNIPINDPYKAYLRGIEFSWQTHLWYLPWVLNGIVLDLNVSFMSSAQTYPYFGTVAVGSGLSAKNYLQYQATAGQLQDQPKATYNAILGWDYKGFSSRFSFRYQQVTLTNLDTQYPVRDAYYDNVLLVDISVKQNLVYNLSIFANVTNINSHIDNYYLSYYNGNNGSSGHLPTSQQTYGMQAQFGVSFNY